MNDNKTATTLSVSIHQYFLLRLKVAANLPMDDEYVGLSQFRSRGKNLAASRLRTSGIQQGNPITEKGRVIMISYTVRFWPRSNEDPQRLGGRKIENKAC